MTEQALQAITNYRRLSPALATAGQPTEAQLANVAQAGFQVVINLALTDATYSLPDEQGTVESLGMAYQHIPVIWEKPTLANLEAFFQVMEQHQDNAVFVHCAANMRVSAFIALWRMMRLGWSEADAMPDVYAIWQPNETWQSFMDHARGSGSLKS